MLQILLLVYIDRMTMGLLTDHGNIIVIVYIYIYIYCYIAIGKLSLTRCFPHYYQRYNQRGHNYIRGAERYQSAERIDGMDLWQFPHTQASWSELNTQRAMSPTYLITVNICMCCVRPTRRCDLYIVVVSIRFDSICDSSPILKQVGAK